MSDGGFRKTGQPLSKCWIDSHLAGMSTETIEPEAEGGVVTAEELQAAAFDSVLDNPLAIDPYDHWAALNRAANAAKEASDDVGFRAYKLMCGICSMSLDPENTAEPFRPGLVLEGRRSMIPADLLSEQYEELTAVASSIRAPALCARIADVCWTSNRAASAMAEMAVASYARSIRSLLKARSDGREERLCDPDAISALQRALNIQRMIGWDKPAAEDLRALVRDLRQIALETQSTYVFSKVVEIDAQYEISSPLELAAQAETLAKSMSAAGKFHWAHEMWLATARFRRRSGDREAAHPCVIEAAEQLVKIADQSELGLQRAVWLDKAIATLKKAKGTGARRKDLQVRLLDAQADIAELITPIETSIDITDAIKSARDGITGLPMIEAILVLAALGRSPEPEKLRAEERRVASQFVLSSLFDTVIHSHDWRKTATIPGTVSGNEEALRGRIVQVEEHRRKLQTAVTEHARFQLALEHSPSLELMVGLATLSPCVEPDHELIVGKGLVYYVGGDHLTALHLLLPQLESSLRHLLKLGGEDCVVIRPDGTQEKAKLGDLLGKLRPKLVDTLGEAIVFEIENLFTRPEGPKLRPNVAHGLLPQYALMGSDATYACWFLFRLILLPLIGRAEEVRAHLGELAGG